MATLTVTLEGQVTLDEQLLEHLGIQRGGKLEVDLLPDGQAAMRASRPSGRIEDFFGILAGKTTKVATLEEIEEAIADGWAHRRSQ